MTPDGHDDQDAAFLIGYCGVLDGKTSPYACIPKCLICVQCTTSGTYTFVFTECSISCCKLSTVIDLHRLDQQQLCISGLQTPKHTSALLLARIWLHGRSVFDLPKVVQDCHPYIFLLERYSIISSIFLIWLSRRGKKPRLCQWPFMTSAFASKSGSPGL